MIETKEQYELFKGWMSVRGTGSDDTDVSTRDAVETIEALRDVIKVAQFVKYMSAVSFDTALNEQLDKLRAVLDDLPDWIADD